MTYPTAHAPAPPPAVVQTHDSWAVEIGPLRFAVTRTRERPASGGAPEPRTRPFIAGAVTGLGAVGLLVVGADATPRPVAPMPQMVSVPVPEPVRRIARRSPRPAQKREPSARLAAPAATGDRFDTADEPYVGRAVATGAFQEWTGADGLSRYLTAGPARVVDGRACRDLALLKRLPEGGSHVRSAERCTDAPVGDAAPAEEAAPETVDGAS